MDYSKVFEISENEDNLGNMYDYGMLQDYSDKGSWFGDILNIYTAYDLIGEIGATVVDIGPVPDWVRASFSYDEKQREEYLEAVGTVGPSGTAVLFEGVFLPLYDFIRTAPVNRIYSIGNICAYVPVNVERGHAA